MFAFIPALIVVYFTAVKKEEQYLVKKFGKEYLDYKKKVRRWL
jgi:protein-S-isoprenylcysteine O-methyltransferase Ste14